MIYEVPKDFKSGNYNTNSYRSYTYNENNNYCRIKIETRKEKGVYTSTELYMTDKLITNKTDKAYKRVLINAKCGVWNWGSIEIEDTYNFRAPKRGRISELVVKIFSQVLFYSLLISAILKLIS